MLNWVGYSQHMNFRHFESQKLNENPLNGINGKTEMLLELDSKLE